MQALIDAIKLKFQDSALYNAVGGRVYFDMADTNEYPRVVYHIITSTPDDTFTENYDNTLIQFDLFAAKSADTTEITTMYQNLITLFSTTRPDGSTARSCQITLSTGEIIPIRHSNLVTLSEDFDEPLPDGTTGLSHFAVDFEVG